MSFTRSMRVPATKYGSGRSPVPWPGRRCRAAISTRSESRARLDDSTEYLNAAVDGPSGPRHLVFALSLKDGSLLPGWPVNVADALEGEHQNFVPRDQNQRGALAIVGGRFMCLSAVISAIAASITASSWVFLFPRATAPSILEGFPLAIVLPCFEAVAIASAVRGHAEGWEGLEWLCYLNEVDPQPMADALRALAANVRARAPETGVHPGLPARGAALLLWLSGWEADEEVAASIDPRNDRGLTYEKDYLANPSRSFFALEQGNYGSTGRSSHRQASSKNCVQRPPASMSRSSTGRWVARRKEPVLNLEQGTPCATVH
jgi:hypothetical protein